MKYFITLSISLFFLIAPAQARVSDYERCVTIPKIEEPSSWLLSAYTTYNFNYSTRPSSASSTEASSFSTPCKSDPTKTQEKHQANINFIQLHYREIAEEVAQQEGDHLNHLAWQIFRCGRGKPIMTSWMRKHYDELFFEPVPKRGGEELYLALTNYMLSDAKIQEDCPIKSHFDYWGRPRLAKAKETEKN